MKRVLIIAIVLFFVAGILFGRDIEYFFKKEKNSGEQKRMAMNNLIIDLPAPDYESQGLERIIKERRSVRNYREEPLTKNEVSRLLWAAQGVTDELKGFRAVPSAGALYPLEIYIDVKNVDGLAPGVYKFQPEGHRLRLENEESRRQRIYQASFRQDCVLTAPLLIIIAGVYERTTGKYGKRGERYVHMEAGHAAQNVYLLAASMGLGTVSVGAFSDEEIKMILGIKAEPLYLLPVGKPQIGP